MPALLTRVGRGVDHEVDEDIDPRIQARRDEVARGMGRRRRRRWLVLVALVLTALAAYGLSRTPALDIDELAVTGAVQTPATDVVAASGLRIGQPLSEVGPAEAAARVEAMPWIRSAAVTRGWDGRVVLEVAERTAELQLADGAGGWLAVDGEGRVLGQGAQPAPGLPVLEGVAPAPVGATVDPRVHDALHVARSLTPALRSRVTAIVAAEGGQLELTLRPVGRVRLGPPEAVPAKIRALQVLFGQVDLRDLCGVDLRVPEAPVLTRSQTCA
jgi:cell division protein FtsQ